MAPPTPQTHAVFHSGNTELSSSGQGGSAGGADLGSGPSCPLPQFSHPHMGTRISSQDYGELRRDRTGPAVRTLFATQPSLITHSFPSIPQRIEQIPKNPLTRKLNLDLLGAVHPGPRNDRLLCQALLQAGGPHEHGLWHPWGVNTSLGSLEAPGDGGRAAGWLRVREREPAGAPP